MKQISRLIEKLRRTRQVSAVLEPGRMMGKVEALIRRKESRVRLMALHSVYFELRDGTRLELGNLSISGMGLLRRFAPEGLEIRSVLEGDLVFGESRVSLRAEVMHSNDTIVGCRFRESDAVLSKLIQSYFHLELNALSMISVRTEMLQADPDGDPHWIHGKNNCEVFFISEGDRIVRFNLTFFGNYIEGAQGSPAKYGQVVEDDFVGGKPKHKGASLIRWDSALAESMETYALRFLGAVPHLRESHRSELIRLVRTKR